MQRRVVSRKADIFDYVVDFAIKQHNQPDGRFGGPELWNIATRRYSIKFCGANGLAYSRFRSKFNCKPDKIYVAQVLRWQKGNDKIEMSVSYYCQKYNHVSKKRRYLFVNYIVVNGELVYKCKPCHPINPKKEYWFEY